jgi:gentisate 1,2-dioxygenase
MEFFTLDMKNLPQIISTRLSELRELDNESREKANLLNEEEHKLFEDITALSKENPDFDEEPVHARFQNLLARRHETLDLLDKQMKKVQKLYNLVDGRIAYLGKLFFQVAYTIQKKCW